MNRRLHTLVLFFAFCLPIVATSADASAFLDLDFEAARDRAGRERKLLMIAFSTPRCKPCKTLEATWQDPVVDHWLRDRVIAIRADMIADDALRANYKVKNAPTQVFVDGTGHHEGRLIGYRDPAAFIADAETAVFSGNSPVARKRSRQLAQPDDPAARRTLAEALAREGKNDEALIEYLWLFGHYRDQPRSAGERAAVLANLGNLARRSPAVRASLRAHRDDIADRALDGQASVGELRDVVELDSAAGLGEPERTLELYDSLIALVAMVDSRKALAALIENTLRQGHRYADLVRDLDPAASFAAAANAYAERAQRATALSADLRALAAPAQKTQLIDAGGDAWEILVGAGDLGAAEAVLDRLLTITADFETFTDLAQRSRRLDVPAAHATLVERARGALSKTELEAIFPSP